MKKTEKMIEKTLADFDFTSALKMHRLVYGDTCEQELRINAKEFLEDMTSLCKEFNESQCWDRGCWESSVYMKNGKIDLLTLRFLTPTTVTKRKDIKFICFED